MTDVLTLAQQHPKTFKHFSQWLYATFNQNNQKFTNFGSAPNRYKLFYFIEYLEQWKVPILAALCYYNYKSSNQALGFEELLTYLVSEEFARLEAGNKKIDYTPF